MTRDSPMKPSEETDDNNAKKDAGLAKIFADFADITTAHGYGQLISAKSILLRIFWIICILVCHVFIMIHIYNLIDKYLSKPTVTTVNSEIENQVVFPVIVLCNENMVKQSEIPNILSEMDTIYKKGGLDVPDVLKREDFSILAYELKNKMLKFGHSFTSMFHECKFLRHHNCKSEEYWEQYWHGRYGSCFVFNAKKSFNGTAKTVRTVSNIGPHHALTVKINVEQQHYFANFSDAAGIRVYIGHQDIFYEPYSEGHSLGPGFQYNIGIKQKLFKRSDRFANGSCVENRPMEFYHHGQFFRISYDRKVCAEICKIQNIIRMCNCNEFHSSTTDPSKRVCRKEDETCVKTSKEDNSVKNCLHKCQPPCKETKFAVQISSLLYPSNVQQAMYAEDLSIVRGEVLRFDLFFQELATEVWEDKLYYSVENLLSDIGGNLGLFSGYSVLTVLEICVLIGVLIKFFGSTTYKKQLQIAAMDKNTTS